MAFGTIELERAPTTYPKQWAYRNRTALPKNFVVWDGEGMSVKRRHEYTYLCAFDGELYSSIGSREGLSTLRCLKLLVTMGAKYPKRVHVVYGGSYDFNMILRDLPEKKLRELYTTHRTTWQGFKLNLTPRKCLSVNHPNGHVVLWDTIGFFQSSFVNAITKWDIDLTEEELAVIDAGKKKRSRFTLKDFDNVNAYCRTELQVFMRLIRKLDDLRHTLGLSFKRWDGAGAVAACYLAANGIRDKRQEPDYSSEFYERVRRAYAGGRIELFQPGDHWVRQIGRKHGKDGIWHGDINSAYPCYISQLPDLSTAKFRYCARQGCEIGSYDLVHILYSGDISAPAHPFYHRDYDGTICFPSWVDSWYWAPEVLAALDTVKGVNVLDHYHLDHSGEEPFHWVREQYAIREKMKPPYEYRAEEKVIKLGLNSIYGKLAQQSGWRDDRIPTYHQLEWAGWVTSSTRAAIWRGIAPAIDSIIAIETDGIYSRKPLNVPIGSGLGEWASESLTRLTYVQSGVYFLERGGRLDNRYRGIDQFDKDGNPAFTRDKLLTSWEAMSTGSGATYVTLPSTRFITLGAALQSVPISENWRQWVTSPREISLIPVGKRWHPMTCHDKWGEGLTHETLPLVPDTASYPFAIEWVSEEERIRHRLFMAQMQEEREEADQWE